jgi:uncharacterized membrane protein YozB (DUF420 family)
VLQHLPELNASLNALATVLLVLGWIAIRGGRRERHGLLMRLAFGVSALFLCGYLTYHFAVVPEVGHTEFRGEGSWRTLYYALLLSHVLLAVVNLPMVLRTLWLAHREDWERHRFWARRTFPVWLYVSVTGVLVYLSLYVWNPA